jgi:hypothetical protein
LSVPAEDLCVTDRPARSALTGALSYWQRHVAALLVAGAAVWVTHTATSSPGLRYGSYLVVFTIWMLWFVLTTVEWIRRADF